MRADALADALDAAEDRPTLVCAQAGNVNTGAFDPLGRSRTRSRAMPNAWLHVDGAFGLWAAASPRLRHLVEGVERADSWATDAHKWLNVGYDCGFVAVRDPEAHRAAMATSARVPACAASSARLGVRARQLAPGARLRPVRGHPIARPRGRARRSSSAAARWPAHGRPAGRRPRRRGPQRRGPQPGAGPLRRRRRATRARSSRASRQTERPGWAARPGRACGDADQRQQLVDHRGRCRPHGDGHRGRHRGELTDGPRMRGRRGVAAEPGLRRASANALAAEGCNLLIWSRDEGRLATTADELRGRTAWRSRVAADALSPDAAGIVAAAAEASVGSTSSLNAGCCRPPTRRPQTATRGSAPSAACRDAIELATPPPGQSQAHLGRVVAIRRAACVSRSATSSTRSVGRSLAAATEHAVARSRASVTLEGA